MSGRLRRAYPLMIAAIGACARPLPHSPIVEPSPRVRQTPMADEWVPDDAASGVRSADLSRLLVDHWTFQMTESPVWASKLGIHRFDDRLGRRSQAAIEVRRKKNHEYLSRARAIGEKTLEAKDAATLRLFADERASEIATDVCDYELWSLSPRSNPIIEWNRLHEAHRVESVVDGRNLLARYREIPRVIGEDIDNLRRGAKRGLFANAESTRRVISMIEKELAKPLDSVAMLEPLKAEHADWPIAERDGFRRDLRAAVETGVRPALARYLAVLKDEVLPRARGSEAEGIGALPNGAACYRAEIRHHTTLDKTAEEIHALGLSEIERTDREILELGKKLFKKRDLAAVLETLRSDPKLYFESADEIVAKAEHALARAKAKMPDLFGRLPKAECVVRRIPDYEAPYTTIAYYKQPHPDGSKPGEYYVNVLDPNKRPRFEAEVLAYHESIPGHHLQIAISQELGDVPAFRKHGLVSSFVEGWALYTERLADESGLFTSDLDRIGLLSFDAWRASRLVVDTGIHALGWTRERAERYMLDHTALTRQNITNEVDRYIVWPGQALAYKIGQLEVLRLRDRAKSRLGARFRLTAFHDVVLAGGSVSLPELSRQVDSWIASELGASG